VARWEQRVQLGERDLHGDLPAAESNSPSSAAPCRVYVIEPSPLRTACEGERGRLRGIGGGAEIELIAAVRAGEGIVAGRAQHRVGALAEKFVRQFAAPGSEDRSDTFILVTSFGFDDAVPANASSQDQVTERTSRDRCRHDAQEADLHVLGEVRHLGTGGRLRRLGSDFP